MFSRNGIKRFIKTAEDRDRVVQQYDKEEDVRLPFQPVIRHSPVNLQCTNIHKRILINPVAITPLHILC